MKKSIPTLTTADPLSILSKTMMAFLDLILMIDQGN